MSLFKKIIDIYISFISIIIIISPESEKNTKQEYCDIYKYCSDCTLCGNETNDYTPCSYYNLFCTQKPKNSTSFQQSYIKKYSAFFRNIPNTNEFCGPETYNLNKLKSSFSIVKKPNININNLKIVHCNYEIHNTKYYNNKLDEATLIIKLYTNNSEKNSLKLILNILLQSSRSKLSKLAIINEIDLNNQRYELTLNEYDNIIILLDFNIDEKTNLEDDEYLEIKIDTNNSNKINQIINFVLIIIFSVLGAIIIISIIFVIYRHIKLRNMPRTQNVVLQQRELQRKKKEIEKINKLLEKILLPKEFDENDVANDCTECTICIEKFAKKCLICVTPCKHIFHYECLCKFIETAKEKQKPVIKCPLCNYDFLEEENNNNKLNEINNVNNDINKDENNINEINNNDINKVEINNDEINYNEINKTDINNYQVNKNKDNNDIINNNEINDQQKNYTTSPRAIRENLTNIGISSEDNLRNNNV